MGMDSKRHLFIISAPSGAGKTTLCQRLLNRFPEQLSLSVSCTTRTPRKNERNGKDYHFISEKEFRSQIHAGEFAEWAEVHGKFYGTLKKTIEGAWKKHRSILLDIDVQGADALKQLYPNETIRIFISPPNMNELENRLRRRGTDSEENIQKRIRNAREEMKQATRFDYQIVNDSLDQAFGELETILRKYL